MRGQREAYDAASALESPSTALDGTIDAHAAHRVAANGEEEEEGGGHVWSGSGLPVVGSPRSAPRLGPGFRSTSGAEDQVPCR